MVSIAALKHLSLVIDEKRAAQIIDLVNGLRHGSVSFLVIDELI
jgi:hypothetical protein